MTNRTSRAGKLESNGSLGVTLQDQTSPTVIANFSILEETTQLSGTVAIDDYVLPVDSASGMTGGKLLSVFDPQSIRFSLFKVVSIDTLNITVDRPIDFEFPTGSYVDVSEVNLAVNGATGNGPILAGLRNNFGAVPPPGIELSLDVTRVLFHCTATTACDLTKFGDLDALENGITLRRRDGMYSNIFNVKNNGEMGGIMYDFTIHGSTNPVQGVDGFLGRLTFAGQSKMGVTQRIAINEDMEIIINDDLSGLTFLEIIAEGSIVIP